MINPVNRGNNEEKIAVYKVEPYVIAADVYAESMHKGRGGWTWYTGSAGWMYQLIIESFIGLAREGNTLKFTPCIPAEWEVFEMTYRFEDSTTYHIEFHESKSETQKTMQIILDGTALESAIIPLENDGITHEVKIELFVT